MIYDDLQQHEKNLFNTIDDLLTNVNKDNRLNVLSVLIRKYFKGEFLR